MRSCLAVWHPRSWRLSRKTGRRRAFPCAIGRRCNDLAHGCAKRGASRGTIVAGRPPGQLAQVFERQCSKQVRRPSCEGRTVASPSPVRSLPRSGPLERVLPSYALIQPRQDQRLCCGKPTGRERLVEAVLAWSPLVPSRNSEHFSWPSQSRRRKALRKAKRLLQHRQHPRLHPKQRPAPPPSRPRPKSLVDNT